MLASLALWLVLSTEPDVDYFVMAGSDDIGEVVKLAGGYAVRLDGLAGGDILFEARHAARGAADDGEAATGRRDGQRRACGRPSKRPRC